MNYTKPMSTFPMRNQFYMYVMSVEKHSREDPIWMGTLQNIKSSNPLSPSRSFKTNQPIVENLNLNYVEDCLSIFKNVALTQIDAGPLMSLPSFNHQEGSLSNTNPFSSHQEESLSTTILVSSHQEDSANKQSIKKFERIMRETSNTSANLAQNSSLRCPIYSNILYPRTLK